MVVVVILALLAGLAAYSIPAYLDRARVKKARVDLGTLAGAVDSFYAENKRYPETREGLASLVPQYLKSLPNDPWGHPYQYIQPGRTGPYDIICYGADGREGGSGADADLNCNDAEQQGAKK